MIWRVECRRRSQLSQFNSRVVWPNRGQVDLTISSTLLDIKGLVDRLWFPDGSIVRGAFVDFRKQQMTKLSTRAVQKFCPVFPDFHSFFAFDDSKILLHFCFRECSCQICHFRTVLFSTFFSISNGAMEFNLIL